MSATIKYVSDDNNTTLLISKSVINTWQSLKQDKESKKESFGVLIGGQNQTATRLWIEANSVPLAKDKSTRTSFSLKDTGHQKLVNKFYKSSKGTSGYLGTWHTHPEETPTPSRIDLKDWIFCCERNPDRKLIFVLVGISHFCVYHRSNDKFERIYKEVL